MIKIKLEVDDGVKYALDLSALKYIGSNYPFLLESGLEKELGKQINCDSDFVLDNPRVDLGYQIWDVSFNPRSLGYQS